MFPFKNLVSNLIFKVSVHNIKSKEYTYDFINDKYDGIKN